MRKTICKLVTLAALLMASPAFAQFSQDAVVGSSGGGSPGGSNGQIQYNNSSSFGGFTQSGDCTTVTSTGVTSCNGWGPAKLVGYYVPNGNWTTWTTASAQAANTINCAYGEVGRAVHIDSISANITTASAGNNIQLAAYSDVGGRPGALVASTGNISTTSTGNVTGSVTSTAIGPGSAAGKDLWWCVNSDNAVVALTSPGATGTNGAAVSVGSTTLANVLTTANQITGVFCTGANCNGGSSTFNTWPTLTGSTWSDITSVRRAVVVAVHVSSVP
jgi:hypothetical protein